MGVVKPTANEAARRKLFEAARRFGIEVLVAEPETPGRMGELPKVMDVVEKLAREFNPKVVSHNHLGPENSVSEMAESVKLSNAAVAELPKRIPSAPN
jgi:sugar phosphate isomerase/epimerase